MSRLGKLVKGHHYQVGRFAGSWYVADLDRMKFVYGPFVRRETAEARIRKIVHMSRRNPEESKDYFVVEEDTFLQLTKDRQRIAGWGIHSIDGTLMTKQEAEYWVKRRRESGEIAYIYQRRSHGFSKINPEWKAPLTKRKKKRLGVLYQKAFTKFSKENPRHRGTLIYGRVLKIFARKTEGPYKGQDFVHTFKPGAIMVGMPDGSLRITHG